MCRFPLFLLFLSEFFTTAILETPQQIVTKYSNYKAICSGLGYRDTTCQSKGIAFQAVLIKSITSLGAQKPVIFEKMTLNEGLGYDATTGKFTAPEDGIYSFSWNVLVLSGKAFHTEIVKDGKMVARNYADGKIVKSGLYLASSSTVNIKLKSKEKVWIRVHLNFGEYVYGNHWSYFSGFRIN
ncbi:complement C1q tumor necrosis factor-related protein 7-like [Saccostrea cucullata]|uniref:complement C1q tumor necrosis factor-related protein 7-like n=1 Tax=Saccostrea cuccullata TaxID=36930 RepID=UPI002ED5B794